MFNQEQKFLSHLQKLKGKNNFFFTPIFFTFWGKKKEEEKMSDLFDILVANEASKYLVSEYSKKYIRLAWKKQYLCYVAGKSSNKKTFIKKIRCPNMVDLFDAYCSTIFFLSGDFFSFFLFFFLTGYLSSVLIPLRSDNRAKEKKS